MDVVLGRVHRRQVLETSGDTLSMMDLMDLRNEMGAFGLRATCAWMQHHFGKGFVA
jgi:hypothetical protein